MTSASETYKINRSEFTRQDSWIPEALASASFTLGGFFLQFQSCFGRSATPSKNHETKGIYMSQNDMAKLMTEHGVKVDRKTVNRHLGELVDLGIVSKSPVCDLGFEDHSSNRMVWVYLLNVNAPFENDALAEKLAQELLKDSKFKGQAEGSYRKKTRAAKAVVKEETPSKTFTAATEVATKLTSDTKVQSFIVDYLNTDDMEHAVAYAAKAAKSCEKYKAKMQEVGKTARITQNVFDQGLKDFDSIFTLDQERAIAGLRDYMNNARKADKEATFKAPESHVQPVLNASLPTTLPRLFKTSEQVKLEDQMRREDIEAEKQRILQEEFDRLLEELV